MELCLPALLPAWEVPSQRFRELLGHISSKRCFGYGHLTGQEPSHAFVELPIDGNVPLLNQMEVHFHLDPCIPPKYEAQFIEIILLYQMTGFLTSAQLGHLSSLRLRAHFKLSNAGSSVAIA